MTNNHSETPADSPSQPSASPTPLNPEEMRQLTDLAKQQAERVMGTIPVLGGVVWLMMQQPGMRHTLLSELEWRVMPALVLQQSKLYMRDSAPVAYVSWAKLSEAAAQRYMEAPHHLTAADWKSGEQFWIIDLVTPFGGAPEVIQELRATVFAGATVQQLMPAVDGQPKSMTWPAVQAGS
ncbi:MAG: toxin-activating lysine-acyltransferase [Rhodoferax sp.]